MKSWGRRWRPSPASAFPGNSSSWSGSTRRGRSPTLPSFPLRETPGLGDKMDPRESDFHVQFMERDPGSFKLLVKKDRGDVDAINASTITSPGLLRCRQRAYDSLQQINP
ncbi:MAG: FMN-binding protein [Bacteroidales bacterium]